MALIYFLLFSPIIFWFFYILIIAIKSIKLKNVFLKKEECFRISKEYLVGYDIPEYSPFYKDVSEKADELYEIYKKIERLGGDKNVKSAIKERYFDFLSRENKGDFILGNQNPTIFWILFFLIKEYIKKQKKNSLKTNK